MVQRLASSDAFDFHFKFHDFSLTEVFIVPPDGVKQEQEQGLARHSRNMIRGLICLRFQLPESLHFESELMKFGEKIGDLHGFCL